MIANHQGRRRLKTPGDVDGDDVYALAADNIPDIHFLLHLMSAARVNWPLRLGHKPDDAGREHEADRDGGEHVESSEHDALAFDQAGQHGHSRIVRRALRDHGINCRLPVMHGAGQFSLVMTSGIRPPCLYQGGREGARQGTHEVDRPPRWLVHRG